MHFTSPSTGWLICSLAFSALLPLACKEKPSEETVSEPTEEVEQPSVEAPPEAAETSAAKADPVDSAAAEGNGGAAPAASVAEADEKGSSEKQGGEKTPTKKAPAPTPPPAAGEPEKPPGYTGPDPCRAKSFKFASVRNACNQGGVRKAKSLMKGMVKRAKDDGKDIKCSSCHDDTKTYTQKPNAVEDMRALQ